MKNKSLFITGTNTGVGKTVVCGCLARFLSRQGINVGIQKWVSTGNKYTSEDIEYSLALQGRSIDKSDDPTLLSPYTFDFPSSPHLAAELEGEKISLGKIKKSYYALLDRHDLLLVEGVGGVLVPLTRDYLLIDLMADLALPVLIVAHSGLGTINHSLLTIEALRKRNINIVGMVFNFAGEGDRIIEDDNMKIIAHLGGIHVFGSLPKVDSQEMLIERFELIGENIHRSVLT